MTERAQVWIHPNIDYMGGEYDEETGRTVFGGPWEDRVEEANAAYDGDRIAVTTYEKEWNLDDPPYDPEQQLEGEYKEQTAIPFDTSSYDAVIEDGSRGDLDDEQYERLAEQYDHLDVGGGYLTDCMATFIDGLLEADADITVSVDPETAFAKGEGTGELRDRDAVLNRSREEREQDISSVPPVATAAPDRMERFRARYSETDRVELLD